MVLPCERIARSEPIRTKILLIPNPASVRSSIAGLSLLRLIRRGGTNIKSTNILEASGAVASGFVSDHGGAQGACPAAVPMTVLGAWSQLMRAACHHLQRTQCAETLVTLPDHFLPCCPRLLRTLPPSPPLPDFLSSAAPTNSDDRHTPPCAETRDLSPRRPHHGAWMGSGMVLLFANVPAS